MKAQLNNELEEVENQYRNEISQDNYSEDLKKAYLQVLYGFCCDGWSPEMGAIDPEHAVWSAVEQVLEDAPAQKRKLIKIIPILCNSIVEMCDTQSETAQIGYELIPMFLRSLLLTRTEDHQDSLECITAIYRLTLELFQSLEECQEDKLVMIHHALEWCKVSVEYFYVNEKTYKQPSHIPHIVQMLDTLLKLHKQEKSGKNIDLEFKILSLVWKVAESLETVRCTHSL
jgi:hypothetical protein